MSWVEGKMTSLQYFVKTFLFLVWFWSQEINGSHEPLNVDQRKWLICHYQFTRKHLTKHDLLLPEKSGCRFLYYLFLQLCCCTQFNLQGICVFVHQLSSSIECCALQNFKPKNKKKKNGRPFVFDLRDNCIGWTERICCFLPSGLKARAFYQSPFKWGFSGLGTCLCSAQQSKMLLKKVVKTIAQINKYIYVFLQCYVFL